MKPFNYLANAVRAPEIVAILVRWGFEDLLLQLDTPQFLLRNLVRKKVAHLSTYERVRNACEELGPIFVKLGQLLSTRSDQLPAELIHELKKLRCGVQAQRFDKIEPLLVRELGADLNTVFSEFESQPVAAGSLGQAYRARLRSNGAHVCVKVQRADIHKTVAADLEIIGWFTRQINNRIDSLKSYNLVALFHEAERRLQDELNYLKEAENAALFQALSPVDARVFAPKVFRQASTRRVLISEWVDGCMPEAIAANTTTAKDLAKLGAQSMLHQIFVTGFFHADPHSGNLLVTSDHRICFLDWGQAGQITVDMRYTLVDLFAAINQQDVFKIMRVAERMAINHRPYDRQRVESGITLLMHRHHYLQNKGAGMGQIGLELMYLFGRNGLTISPDYALLAKAIMCVEESGRMMDPDFDLQQIARSYIEDLNRHRWSQEGILQQTVYPFLSAINQARDLPANLQRVLLRLEAENFKFTVQHSGTQSLEKSFRTGINRLIGAILVSALLLAGALIIRADVPPYIAGYPALALLGFSLAGVLAFILFCSILQRR